MRKIIPALLLGVSLVIGQIPVTAGVSGGEGIVVEQAPPLPRHEAGPKKTRRGYVWAQGYWTISGRHYSWQKGHWLPVRPGYEYEQAEWVKVPGGWKLRPGNWRPLPSAPAQS